MEMSARLKMCAVALLLTGMGNALAATATECPRWPGAPSACVRTEHGFFYAEDEARAREHAEDGALTARLFEQRFGRAPAMGAVVPVDVTMSAGGALLPVAADASLKQAGARWSLPWLGQEARLKLKESALRQSLPATMPAAERERTLAAALAKDKSHGAAERDRGALRHEIGHVLLTEAFWPAAGARKGAGHYGGPAPDWLDETAAVLMENEVLTESRRKALREGVTLEPLATFFSRAHPLANNAQVQAVRRAAEAGGGSVIRVVTGNAAERLTQQTSAKNFYTQARALIDFMDAQTAKPGAFGEIAAFAAEGKSMAQWLEARGSVYGLPNAIAGLEARWQSWLNTVPKALATRD